jgi:hypothetical protein
MSDNIKYIDVDDEQFEDAPKALRDAYKALRKQAENLTTERDGALKQVASRAVADVLDDKGFKNPKRVERDLLADGIDPLDSSAVEAWLTSNGDDYARSEGSGLSKPEHQQTEEEKALQEGYEAIAGGDQLKAAADLSKWDLAQSEITEDMNGEQVAAVYKRHGI